MSNQKPVAELRLGKITAAIWANETEKGTFYNIKFSRLYREGEEWKRNDSYSRDDLLLLAKLADQAHTRIYELQQQHD